MTEGPLPAVLTRRPRGAGRRSPFARLTRWVRRTYLHPEMPHVAVEFRAGSVGVVRVRRERGATALVSAASLDLPPGALVPSLLDANIGDPERVRNALRGALERCGVLGGARAAVVLPDPVARVSLVPEADLTGKRDAEVEEVLRFRLRKSLPFDVREARLAWATVGNRGSDPAVVISTMGTVVEGYEAVCRSVGLEPGLVEISALALARGAFPPASEGDRLLVNWEDAYATVLIVRGDWPVLVRTLSGVVTTPAELARELSSTLLYYGERLGGTGIVSALVRATPVAPDQAVALVEQAAGVETGLVDPLARLEGGAAVSAGPLLAGAASALGAAA